MTPDEIIEHLTELGFAEVGAGLTMDGYQARRLKHPRDTERGSLYVSPDRILATGNYMAQLGAVPPTGHGPLHGYPYWEGESLKKVLNCLDERYLSEGVRDLVRRFDALPPAERHQVATVILRRSTGSGEMPEAAFDEIAAELSWIHDTEEAEDANPQPG